MKPNIIEILGDVQCVDISKEIKMDRLTLGYTDERRLKLFAYEVD